MLWYIDRIVVDRSIFEYLKHFGWFHSVALIDGLVVNCLSNMFHMFFETESQSMKWRPAQQSRNHIGIPDEELNVLYAYGYVSTG